MDPSSAKILFSIFKLSISKDTADNNRYNNRYIMALLTDPALIALMNDLKESDEVTSDVCNVCTEANDLTTITLTCKHRFHTACFLKSIRSQYFKIECPYCRSIVHPSDYKSTCTHVITRGPNRGSLCGKTCYADSKLCQTHGLQKIKKQQKCKKKSEKQT